MYFSIKYSFQNIRILILVLFITSCKSMPDDNVSESGRMPLIYPDYSGITIPSNIAPLNFLVKEPGTKYSVKITAGNEASVIIKSRNGKIQIPHNKWKELLTTARETEINIDIYVSQMQPMKTHIRPNGPNDSGSFFHTITLLVS